MTTLNTVTGSGTTSLSKIIRNAAITIVISAILNVIIGFIGTNVLGADPAALPMQIPVIISATIAFLVVATIVYYVITRVSKNPAGVWRVVAVIALLLSFIPLITAGSGQAPPMPMPEGVTLEFSTAIILALALMHIASGIVAFVVMPRE